jgi:hypothetical protein
MQITSAGFQFLLHSPHAQLWDLLLEYLHMAEVSRSMLSRDIFLCVSMSNHLTGAAHGCCGSS